MTKPIVEFGRRFQVWEYSVSHGQLLLRSVQGPGHATQVDVLFKNVTGISLPTLFQGLKVSRAPIDQAAAIGLGSGSSGLGGQEYFKISGENWSGGILAGAMFWVDDMSDYHGPSKLMSGHWKGPSA